MNPAELKAVVEFMEGERGVEREVIIRAIELALKAPRSEMKDEQTLRISIDRTTFQMKAYRKLGMALIGPPPVVWDRIAAQNAKQVIMQKIRQAEKEIILDEYKDRIGEIVTGTVVRLNAQM